jgi:hypothetical protein
MEHIGILEIEVQEAFIGGFLEVWDVDAGKTGS